MSQNETSIWQDFGISDNDVVSSVAEDPAHIQAMLELNVDTRDGDASIDLADADSGEILTEEQLRQRMDGSQGDIYGDQGEDSIRVNTENGEEVTEGSEAEESEGGDTLEDVDLSQAPEELSASVTALQEHTNGFNAMVEKALEGGDIDNETLEGIKAEYLSEGDLSEKTLALLESKGYSRGFVNSFIRGQELLTSAYAQQVVDYVGGTENFNNTRDYLAKNNPEMAEMLDEALEDLDIKAVRAIFESVKGARVARFGKQPARSITSQASTQKPAQASKKSEAAQPFDSVDDMMKAMDDPRYRNDSRYRAQVEARIVAKR